MALNAPPCAFPVSARQREQQPPTRGAQAWAPRGGNAWAAPGAWDPGPCSPSPGCTRGSCPGGGSAVTGPHASQTSPAQPAAPTHLPRVPGVCWTLSVRGVGVRSLGGFQGEPALIHCNLQGNGCHDSAGPLCPQGNWVWASPSTCEMAPRGLLCALRGRGPGVLKAQPPEANWPQGLCSRSSPVLGSRGEWLSRRHKWWAVAAWARVAVTPLGGGGGAPRQPRLCSTQMTTTLPCPL